MSAYDNRFNEPGRLTMVRVTKANPCPVCSKPTWCLYEEDGSAAICQRVQEGSVKRCGEAGFLHKLTDNPGPVKHRPNPKPSAVKREPTPDFFKLVKKCRSNVVTKEMVAKVLGIQLATLERLEFGYGKFYGNWWQTYPMRDGHNKIVGIRLRAMDGKGKIAVTGSKNALFWPIGVEAESKNLLFICEGPTDTAALLELGFDAIGRASCNTGFKYIKTLLGRFDREVVIMSDTDEAKTRPDGSVFYPGIEGALWLAKELKPVVRSIRVIKPPCCKDVRGWIQHGATKNVILDLVKNSKFI